MAIVLLIVYYLSIGCYLQNTHSQVDLGRVEASDNTPHDSGDAGDRGLDHNHLSASNHPGSCVWYALVLLVTISGFIALCTWFFVSAIDYSVAEHGVHHELFGLVLLPVVVNAVRLAMSVGSARLNNMDNCISIDIGYSTNTSLMVTPLVVILGWCLGIEDMTLCFNILYLVIFFAALLLMFTQVGPDPCRCLSIKYLY